MEEFEEISLCNRASTKPLRHAGLKSCFEYDLKQNIMGQNFSQQGTKSLSRKI